MQKQKMLICDDEKGVRESLKLILGERYDLVFAENGEGALQILTSSPDIKLVFLDIKMPGKSGLEVLKEIKFRNESIPVIIITGYQSVETAAKAIRFGAANYIIKPFESKSVIKAAEKILS